MTWKEIKLATLQKMFSAEGANINENDEAVRPYLNAMPHAANEGLQLISAAGLRPTAWLELEKPENTATIDLTTACPQLDATAPFAVYWMNSAGRPLLRPEALVTAGRWLTLPWQEAGKVQLAYAPLPPVITLATADDLMIPLPPTAAVLLPFYMASQLYKEDDLALSTVYRNEFEAALALLEPQPLGEQGGSFASVSGWV